MKHKKYMIKKVKGSTETRLHLTTAEAYINGIRETFYSNEIGINNEDINTI